MLAPFNSVIKATIISKITYHRVKAFQQFSYNIQDVD